jgi:hypothetical protein
MGHWRRLPREGRRRVVSRVSHREVDSHRVPCREVACIHIVILIAHTVNMLFGVLHDLVSTRQEFNLALASKEKK